MKKLFLTTTVIIAVVTAALYCNGCVTSGGDINNGIFSSSNGAGNG